MKPKLIVIALAAIILTGCTHDKLGGLIGQPTPTPAPQVESTGDVNQDVQAIDQEINSLEEIPNVNETDLGL